MGWARGLDRQRYLPMLLILTLVGLAILTSFVWVLWLIHDTGRIAEDVIRKWGAIQRERNRIEAMRHQEDR